jgi:hypothetical protein
MFSQVLIDYQPLWFIYGDLFYKREHHTDNITKLSINRYYCIRPHTYVARELHK